jgi:hypothetical protein
LKKSRRDEIAFLVSVAGSLYQTSPAQVAEFAASNLRHTQESVNGSACRVHEILKAVLKETKVPSEEELVDYIHELAKGVR